MQDILFPFAGGVGLFLLGMMLLSQGLVAFGGDVLKQALARFTGTPAKAFVSGALATVVLQSSSATTVTLIGFVSAGLISFSQAIGVLIGASLGNTATGWVVAGLGLKVNLGFYTLPLIGLGALAKLLGKGRWAELGLAMAGFGLLFLGLNTLQEGMRGLASVFNLAGLPVGGYGARVMTMLVGLALTALLQSSTAAIATTLTALHTQAINFDQASALVVGAAIGTTLTGALVAIGANLYAKRTALAYILFNAVSGILAIALLPVFLRVIGWLGAHAGLQAGAISLAAFHTLFIAVGVALFLPAVPRFAQVVERLLPERGEDFALRLDASMLALPAVALEASRRALEQITLRLLDMYEELLSSGASPSHAERLAQIDRSLNEIFGFISRVDVHSGDRRTGAQRIAQLHASDHLLRFRSRLHDLARARVDLNAAPYQWALENSRQMLALARQGLAHGDLDAQLAPLELNAVTLTTLSRKLRHDVIEGANSGEEGMAATLARTDAFRWLERTGHHVWRICHHLALARAPRKPLVDAPDLPHPLGEP